MVPHFIPFCAVGAVGDDVDPDAAAAVGAVGDDVDPNATAAAPAVGGDGGGSAVGTVLWVSLPPHRTRGKDYADRLADLERERNTIELEKEQVTAFQKPI